MLCCKGVCIVGMSSRIQVMSGKPLPSSHPKDTGAEAFTLSRSMLKRAFGTHLVVGWAIGANAAVDGLGGASALAAATFYISIQPPRYQPVDQETHNSTIVIGKGKSLPLARRKERRGGSVIARTRGIDADRTILDKWNTAVKAEEGLVAARNDLAGAATGDRNTEAVDVANVEIGGRAVVAELDQAVVGIEVVADADVAGEVGWVHVLDGGIGGDEWARHTVLCC